MSLTQLIVFGNNDCGKLFLDSTTQDVYPPKLLNSTFLDSPVLQVCCTNSATIILTENGSVYGQGVLGSSNNEPNDVAELFIKDKKGFQFNKGGFENNKFVSMSCNSYIVFLMSTDGILYGIGHNGYSNIGQSSPVKMATLTRVATSVPGRIEHFACCFSSSIVVNDQNDVYVLGQISWFKVASGIQALMEPKVPEKIVSASGGYFHGSLLCETGKVYVLGENSDLNKLGVLDRPMKISELTLADEPFIFARSEADYSVFVTKSYRVFACGLRGMKGKLTLGSEGIVELDFIPRSAIVDVTLFHSRLWVSTDDALYSTGKIDFLKPFADSFTNYDELADTKQPLVEMEPSDLGLDTLGHLNIGGSSNYMIFYSRRDATAHLLKRQFGRLIKLLDNSLLCDLEIVTQH